MAKMTKSELERYLRDNHQDSTYRDYLDSDLASIFDVDEDDGFAERTFKGAGSILGQAPVSTGAVAEGLLTGKIDPSELDMNDFVNLMYSIPAFKGMKAGAEGLKTAYKVFQKGGLTKALESVMKKMGPGTKAAKRTSMSQLASLSGLGSKNRTLGSLPGRAFKLSAAGVAGADAIDRSSPVGSADLENPENSQNPETKTLDDPAIEDPNLAPGSGPTLDQPDPRVSAAMNAAQEIQGSGRPDPLTDWAQDRMRRTVQNEANRVLENKIAARKKAEREAAEEAHREDVRQNSPEYQKMEALYDSTGGRQPGDWMELSQAQKDQAFRQFNLNRSAARHKKARISKALEKADRDHIAAGRPGPLPSEAVKFANEKDSFFDDGSISKKEFSDLTGLRRSGTGVMKHADGTFSPREFDGAFDRAGGLESARAFLKGKDPTGEKEAALLHQLSGDRKFRFDDGTVMEGLEVGKDDVIFGADKASYPASNFDTYEDAVAYLNRPDLSSPETLETPETPENPEDDGGSFFDKLYPYAPLAIPLLTRGKIKPKGKGYTGPTTLTKPAPEFVKATPLPRPPVIAKTPGLPNKTPGLPNKPLGLPNKPPGLPNTPQLANTRPVNMQNPSQMTAEQFRRIQSGGLGPSERRMRAQYKAENATRPDLKSSLGVPTSSRRHTDKLREDALEEQRRLALRGLDF